MKMDRICLPRVWWNWKGKVMKDCEFCGTMIPFYGPDICKACQDRISTRTSGEEIKLLEHNDS